MSESALCGSLSDRVSQFNAKVDKHRENQLLNPFSGSFSGDSRSPSPRPKFSKEEYGRPVSGSKTEARGRRAKSHICREILELCTTIHDFGCRHGEAKNDSDAPVIVSFGDLFQLYTKINDKVVGLLIAAKKRKYVYFEGEILFQRRDDDVLIALVKPITEIEKEIAAEIEASKNE